MFHIISMGLRSGEYGGKKRAPRLGNELEGLLVFVWRQVVHDDDFAWAKEGEEDIASCLRA